jgi:hypothetical protein
VPAVGYYAVFTFETTHQAMAAEDVLRRGGIKLEAVPPPSDISAGCGLALRISLGDFYEAVGVLATREAAWEAVYELGPEHEVVAKLG